MKRPILSWRRGSLIVFQGAVIAGSVLLAFATSYHGDPESLKNARTIAFGTLTFSHILFAFSCRHHSRTLFSIGVFSNRWLLAAVFVSLSLQLGVMTLPGVREWFDVTTLLSGEEWLRVVGFSLGSFAVIEAHKLLRSGRRK